MSEQIHSSAGHALVDVAGVERLESGAHELDVRGGRGGLRGHGGLLSAGVAAIWGSVSRLAGEPRPPESFA
jgi:hypothetical protein